MLLCMKVIGVVTFVLVAATLGCSGDGSEARTTVRTTKPSQAHETRPREQGRPSHATEDEWKAVIDDWYDNGKVDATHRCDAVRVAIERLPTSGPNTITAREDLRRVEAVMCGRESRPHARPRWVDAGVARIRRSFAGYPAPSRVTWGESRLKRWATVVFDQPELCRICSGPPDANPTRLKRVTIFFERRSMLVREFTGRAT